MIEHFITKCIPGLLASIVLILLPPALVSAFQLGDPGVYPGLVEKLCPSLRPEHFIAFTDFDNSRDDVIHHAGLDYFNANPDLIQRIRKDLDSPDVKWHLEDLSHRLMYAPESRPDVAGHFTDYCRTAIDDLLHLTGLDNPYHSISALRNNRPDIVGGKGIQVFIVQDLVREYTAQYQFSGRNEKRIMVDLAGKIRLNEVGSYSSYLEYSEASQQHWGFSRSPYTIWKSASSNPYTVLMTPLEETLHILLREHTENAILQSIEGKGQTVSIDEIHSLMESWIAVEEAIVGGLVHVLVPDVILTRVPDLPLKWIQADLKTKSRHDKYRFLPRGIDIVTRRGLKESIDLYARDPFSFRTLLTTPDILPTITASST